MSSKFSDWYKLQMKEFIQEISNGEITEMFIDRNIRAISLKELQELDQGFITSQIVSDDNA